MFWLVQALDWVMSRIPKYRCHRCHRRISDNQAYRHWLQYYVCALCAYQAMVKDDETVMTPTSWLTKELIKRDM